jgi:hypothetical protein
VEAAVGDVKAGLNYMFSGGVQNLVQRFVRDAQLFGRVVSKVKRMYFPARRDEPVFHVGKILLQ